MTSLIRYQPFRELVSLREAMDKLFEDSFITPSRLLRGLREEGMPAIDMYQTKDDVVVKSALPGIKPEDVDITITDNTVTIPKSEQAKTRQIKVKAEKSVEAKK